MAAPKENKFWKLRSKHGRDKIFATPEIMWQAAVSYFEWCEENPLIEVDYRGKDATQVALPKMRPFTMQGLCLYLNTNTLYFRDFENGLKGKTDELSLGFSQIITRIRETIYNQKFTGAAAGFLNPNIIARDLGLTERTVSDITTGGEKFQPMQATIEIIHTGASPDNTNDKTTS